MRMYKLFSYIVCVAAALAVAACTHEMEEVAAPSETVSLQFVVGDFPAFGEAETRAIGTPDVGKTAWEFGDELQIRIDNSQMGYTPCATLVNNEDGWEIKDGNICYRDGITDVKGTVLYAPDYKMLKDGTVQRKDGAGGGRNEYIVGTCTVDVQNRAVHIDFSQAQRNYARLRIASVPHKSLRVRFTKFAACPDTEASAYDYNNVVTDQHGNAFFYGRMEQNGQIQVRYGETLLTTYTFSQATETGKSYALNAPFISAEAMGYEDILNAVQAQVDANQTDIKILFSESAGGRELTAISEVIRNQSEGSIDLTVMGMKSVPTKGFSYWNVLRSLQVPDVEEAGLEAFKNCSGLEVLTAPKLTTLHSGVFRSCPKLVSVTLGAVTYADESQEAVFDSDRTSGIYLNVSDKQRILEKGTDNIWRSTEDSYFSSSQHDARMFMDYTFQEVIVWW